MRSPSSSEASYEVRHVAGRVRHYRWPPLQLNLWFLIMLAAACTIIGIFANFIDIQNQLELPIPWYFTYYITVCALAVAFVLSMLWMMSQRRLLPAVVFVGAFILLVLWTVGMIVVAIQLFGGADGGVNGVCGAQVFGQSPQGQTLYVLAWLQQRSICQSWQAVFAMGLVGTVFLVWIMFMAYQVFADS
jgi:hypothetical protein